MQLAVFRALWGMTGTIEAQIEQIAGAGYDGVEGFIGATTMEPGKFSELVASHGLKLIMAGAADSFDALEPTIKTLAAYNPVKIGLHSGRDHMTRDQGRAYFAEAFRLEQQIGIPISHETHRGRMFFTLSSTTTMTT